MNTMKKLLLFIASSLNSSLTYITDIKNKVSNSGIVSLNGTYCKYVMRNEYVMVFGESANGGISVGTKWVTVGTLPAVARPENEIYFTPTSRGGTALFTGVIRTDGKVELYSTTATPYWGYSMMFPIEDA